MNRTVFYWVVAIVSMFSIGCQNQQNNVIVGRWQLDSLSIMPGTVVLDPWNFDENLKLVETELTMDFHEDKTVMYSALDGYEQRGSYTFEQNPLNLWLYFDEETVKVNVATLTEDRLIFSMVHPRVIDYLVFHYKKVPAPN